MTPQSDRDLGAAAFARLCDWAAGVSFGDIPPQVLRRTALVLIDDLAAMVGGAQAPAVSAYQRQVAQRSAHREATIFGASRMRAGREMAAVANAIATNWLELDEGYRPVPCHAGLYVIPALLASAEGRLDARQVLRMLAVAYELVTRVARGFRVEPVTMQSHGRYAAVGAAAARALALGLDGRALHEALCAAVTLIGPAPRNHLALGAMVRNVWPAAGAWNGMMAVEWTAAGMGGVPGAVHDVYATVLGGVPTPHRMTEGLGEGWAVMDGYTKLYACCQHLHSAVEACLVLLEGAAIDVDAIERVDVHTHPLALPLSNDAPVTTLGGKFSMQHAIAAALVHGTGGARAFDEASLVDPRIARLRARVRMAAWNPLPPPPDDRPARVAVLMRDGARHDAECRSALGGPDRPLGEQAVLDKATGLVASRYPDMVPTLGRLIGLEAEALDLPWARTVDLAFGPASD
jgi:2-methylcitrate dehydratase PrpD